MDWSTVVASAGLSAVVSTLVSLAAVSQVTTRRARAERADAAKQALRAVLRPMRADLTRYELGMNQSLRRKPHLSVMDDHEPASRVWEISRDLPAHRRWLVRRRCRTVFGDFYTDLARDWTYSKDAPGGALIPGLVLRNRTPVADNGLLHLAYAHNPGHPLLAKLARELRRLSRAR